MTAHAHHPTVRDDPENHRYVLELDGEVAGLAVYHIRGGRYIFVHTEIETGHEREGLGSILAREALDDVRAKGARVVPLCPFISAWIRRHPEYQDMVDQVLLEAIDRSS
jgi:predicted GNAT family acetyltransferase